MRVRASGEALVMPFLIIFYPATGCGFCLYGKNVFLQVSPVILLEKTAVNRPTTEYRTLCAQLLQKKIDSLLGTNCIEIWDTKGKRFFC